MLMSAFQLVFREEEVGSSSDVVVVVAVAFRDKCPEKLSSAYTDTRR